MGAQAWWLLIEDDPVDAMAVERSLQQLGLSTDLALIRSGQDPLAEAECFRSEHGGLPEVVVLDINLPLASGHEILAMLRTQKVWRDVPLVILSASDHSLDIERAGALGASRYFVKPHDFQVLVETVREIAAIVSNR